MNLDGRIAAVTGAASGIGRAIAISLAERGCHLALADVNDAGLLQTAASAAKAKVHISTHHLDVANRDAVAGFPAIVKAEHGGADVLVNNAGVALGGTFEQVSEQDFEWLFDINFWGVVRMTRAFLPLLHASSDACIVNMSSVFGIIAPPGQAAYSASKFAVRGFSQALRHELAGTNISVLSVHPGGVATSIADNARIANSAMDEETARRRAQMKKALKLSPAIAGDTIVKAIERRKARVLVGSDAKILALIERMLPVSYWRVFRRLQRQSGVKPRRPDGM